MGKSHCRHQDPWLLTLSGYLQDVALTQQNFELQGFSVVVEVRLSK